MIDTIKCTNSAIEILTLTDDLIVAKCGNCNQTFKAHRLHYSKKTWEQMQANAKNTKKRGIKL